MEKFQELRDLSQKKIQLADHILTMTYPVVKDARLLIGVVENLFLALSYAMSSVLFYERLFKRVPLFPDKFAPKFELFKEKCVEKYKIDMQNILLIQSIKEIVVNHKKSPIEFQRKDQFVICNENYRIRTISVNELKDYIKKGKDFIKDTITITSKEENMFNY